MCGLPKVNRRGMFSYDAGPRREHEANLNAAGEARGAVLPPPPDPAPGENRSRYY